MVCTDPNLEKHPSAEVRHQDLNLWWPFNVQIRKVSLSVGLVKEKMDEHATMDLPQKYTVWLDLIIPAVFCGIKSMNFYYKPHLLRYSRTYPICWLRRQWGRHSLDERRTWRQFQGSIHGADIKVGLSFLRICSLARCRDTVWRSQISDPRPRYFESRVWSISRLCWFRTPLRPDFTKNVVFFTIPWYLIHHPFYAGYCRIRISKIGYDYGKIHGDCTNHVVDVRIGSQPPLSQWSPVESWSNPNPHLSNGW